MRRISHFTKAERYILQNRMIWKPHQLGCLFVKQGKPETSNRFMFSLIRGDVICLRLVFGFEFGKYICDPINSFPTESLAKYDWQYLRNTSCNICEMHFRSWEIQSKCFEEKNVLLENILSKTRFWKIRFWKTHLTSLPSVLSQKVRNSLLEKVGSWIRVVFWKIRKVEAR